jgi:hypothetical protein
MSKTWALVGAMVMVASVAGAQERVAASPELIAKMKLEEAHTRMKLEEGQRLQLTAKVRMPLEAKVVTGAPYSAEVVSESVQVLPDGNRIVNRTTGRVYRDGQGRVRREEDRGDGKAPGVLISDPVAHVSYSLDPDTRVAVRSESLGWVQADGAMTGYAIAADRGTAVFYTAKADPGDLEKKKLLEDKLVAAEKEGTRLRMVEGTAPPAPEWEEKVEKLPARDVEGVAAEGTRVTRTIPAGRIGNERPIAMVTEEWRSTDLQVLVSTSTTDPRTGESTYKLTNIVRGEPAAGNFEVPAGYTVTDAGIKQDFILKRDR